MDNAAESPKLEIMQHSINLVESIAESKILLIY